MTSFVTCTQTTAKTRLQAPTKADEKMGMRAICVCVAIHVCISSMFIIFLTLVCQSFDTPESTA